MRPPRFFGLALFALLVSAVGVLSACSTGRLPGFGNSGGAGGPVPSTPPSLSEVYLGHMYSAGQAQVFVAVAENLYAKYLGEDTKVGRRLYSEPDHLMTAFRNGEVQVAYVDPATALQAFAKQPDFKIVAGANTGGSAIVVLADRGIASLADLKGKALTVPGLGSFQDVILRSVLLPGAGLEAAAESSPGKVQIVPARPGDAQVKLRQGTVDGAFSIEPLPSMILYDTSVQTKVLTDWKQIWRNGDYPGTVLIAGNALLADHPDVVRRVLAAQVEAEKVIRDRPDDAINYVHDLIMQATSDDLPKAMLEAAFYRGEMTADPNTAAVLDFAALMNKTYPDRLSTVPQSGDLFDLRLLNEVLKERGMTQVK